MIYFRFLLEVWCQKKEVFAFVFLIIEFWKRQSRDILVENQTESRFKVRSTDISNVIVFNINLKLSCRDSYGMTKMNKKSFQSFKLRKDVKKKILRNRLILGVFFFMWNRQKWRSAPRAERSSFCFLLLVFFIEFGAKTKKREWSADKGAPIINKVKK